MKKATFIAIILSLFSLAGCASESAIPIYAAHEIEENGIRLRMLSTSTNVQGQTVKTFGYTIIPENASNQGITPSVTYKSGKSCSSVLSVNLSSSERTISLTCKTAFSEQIILRVISNADTSIYATAQIDYTKKIINVSKVHDSDYYVGIGWSGVDTILSGFASVNFITATYTSVYSKDKSYTFGVKNTDISLIGDDGTGLCDFIDEEILRNFEILINNKIKNFGSITEADIYGTNATGFYDDEEWIAMLQDIGSMNPSEAHLVFSFAATYYCIEDPSFSVTYTPSVTHFYLSLVGAYSGF